MSGKPYEPNINDKKNIPRKIDSSSRPSKPPKSPVRVKVMKKDTKKEVIKFMVPVSVTIILTLLLIFVLKSPIPPQDQENTVLLPESSAQETSAETAISSQPVPSQPSNPAFKGDVVSETNKTGNCGGNISYRLENGTLTLTGTGNMYDNFEEFQNDDSIKTVIVNEGITGISAYAFSGCSGLESVDMSKSDIKNIRYCTFENCTDLKNVTLPPNLERIEEYAFASCTSLTALTIPESVSDIDETAFEDCPIDIP